MTSVVKNSFFTEIQIKGKIEDFSRKKGLPSAVYPLSFAVSFRI